MGMMDANSRLEALNDNAAWSILFKTQTDSLVSGVIEGVAVTTQGVSVAFGSIGVLVAISISIDGGSVGIVGAGASGMHALMMSAKLINMIKWEDFIIFIIRSFYC
jgi:hypothetical protein